MQSEAHSHEVGPVPQAELGEQQYNFSTPEQVQVRGELPATMHHHWRPSPCPITLMMMGRRTRKIRMMNFFCEQQAVQQ